MDAADKNTVVLMAVDFTRANESATTVYVQPSMNTTDFDSSAASRIKKKSISLAQVWQELPLCNHTDLWPVGQLPLQWLIHSANGPTTRYQAADLVDDCASCGP